MSSHSWFARRKRRGDDISDVISGEFFPDDGKPSLPLVREALQNAIDAGKLSGDPGPVRVRIALFRGSKAASSKVAHKWFEQLQAHLAATGNGLREAPAPTERCEYMLVEDFGTCGLTGDVDSDEVDGPQNNFVDFLRSDGRTRKAEGEQGSWGVGKNVFPRCSRINSYIAFTKRHDDGQQLLMGKCVLKIRTIGGEQYQPPVYLAESWRESDVPKPIDCERVIDEFQEDFRVERSNECGLTILIPWVHQSVKFEDILHAVVSDYHYAVIAGTLEVTLEDDESRVHLSRTTILGVVNTHADLVQYRESCELAKWSLAVTDENRIVLSAMPPTEGPQKWSPDLLSDAERDWIREALEGGKRVAVRIPLHITPAVGPNARVPTASHLDIYMEYDESIRGDPKPAFFREQLCINDVKRAMGAAKIRSMVVIDDKPLATLLRAAEPPNHSDWVAGTSNFKGLYLHGNHVVTFVKSAVRYLLGLVRSGDDQPDASIAIEYFSRPLSSGSARNGRGNAGNRSGSASPDAETVDVQKKLQRFHVSEVDGGFRIRQGDPGAALPTEILVRIAYDVLSGCPWTLYEPADFDLMRKDRSGITIASSGGVVAEVRDSNRIQLKITSSPFDVYVTGFDVNRDLIVNARMAKETTDVGAADELHAED